MNVNPTYDDLLAANRELAEKVKRLEDVSRSDHSDGLRIRSRFLSNISHEIRTPMNAILGFSGLLQSEELTQSEKEEYLFYISHNSQALLKVMENIIDLTLLETRNLHINEEDVSIQDLVYQVYEYHNREVSRGDGNKVAVIMSMPDTENRLIVKADSDRLRRVMDNLVGCAIKHQYKGAVELRLENPDSDQVLFSIRFEGNTLLLERAKMIFENTGNEDDWHNQLDNTGVACKLAHDLVEAMGGTICMNSAEGGAKAEIRISLPMHSIKSPVKNGALVQEEDLGDIPAFNSN